ncbi:unnamed protein product [Vicia faba]|uniref:PB1-like domain-containing protein n=1 Tax=Vicia faba TaxID=3906 RepID=A0AAV0ZJW8_VICFA|nr:unnamed protein product [Vicia faba]
MDNVVYYLDRYEHVVYSDPDKWSFFEVTDIVKELYHLEYSNYWLLWYNIISGKHKRMVSDSDANEVYEYVVQSNCSVDLYVEHRLVDDNVDAGNVNDVDVDNVNDIDGANVCANVDDFDVDNVDDIVVNVNVDDDDDANVNV